METIVDERVKEIFDPLEKLIFISTIAYIVTVIIVVIL
jgi:hypothetical protein